MDPGWSKMLSWQQFRLHFAFAYTTVRAFTCQCGHILGYSICAHITCDIVIEDKTILGSTSMFQNCVVNRSLQGMSYNVQWVIDK